MPKPSMTVREWKNQQKIACVEALVATRELETRGLVFMVHFGTDNAVSTLKEVDEAFASGVLYEFLRVRFGIGA